MNYKTKTILGDIVVGAILALIIALAAHGCETHAATLPDSAYTPKQLRDKVGAYMLKVHEACADAGGPDSAACKLQQRKQDDLHAKGWVWLADGEYLSADDIAALNNVFVAGDTYRVSVVIDNRAIPSDAVIAYWGAVREQFRDHDPSLWATMSEYVYKLYHAGGCKHVYCEIYEPYGGIATPIKVQWVKS
jgi:hypothetical protein